MKKALPLITMIFLFSIHTFAQEKITMNVKDLNSDIEKYVKKNFEGYKITEAFEYDVVYEMVVRKGDSTANLIFNKKDVFISKKTDVMKSKLAHQTRMSMSLGDVESDITKYIKKNYEGSKLTEAYRYDEVYTTKIVKGTDTQILLFDKEGKFEKKIVMTPAATTQQKTDSVKHEVKTDSVQVVPEPAKTDTVH